MRLSYMFIYMLLGGEYITYKYRIESNEQNNSKQNEEASVSISVISFMVVKIIKYMKAPILLNSIIIGNNLIKNTRLDNFLFFSHIKEIIIKLIIYFFCFFMFEKNDYINFLFLVALFSINIFISLLYLILSKIYRNAAMKSIIAQSIFSDINRGIYIFLTWLYSFFTLSSYFISFFSSSGRIKETSMGHELDNLYTKYSYDHLILFNNSLNYF